MLQFFRNFFKSKVGIAVTLGFLALIAFAFASSDVANTGTFGGVAGGDRVAVVGDSRIDAIDLSARASDQLNNGAGLQALAGVELGVHVPVTVLGLLTKMVE